MKYVWVNLWLAKRRHTKHRVPLNPAAYLPTPAFLWTKGGFFDESYLPTPVCMADMLLDGTYPVHVWGPVSNWPKKSGSSEPLLETDRRHLNTPT